MSTAIEQSVVWMTELHSTLGNQLMSLSNRLASWLLLGNVGALVLMFNSKLGQGFLDQAVAKDMVALFCGGLAFAFCGIVITFIMTSLGYLYVTEAVSLVHDLRVNEQYIKELESDNIEVKTDSYFHQRIDSATEKYKVIPKKAKRLWIGVGVAFILHACSATAFAAAMIISIS